MLEISRKEFEEKSFNDLMIMAVDEGCTVCTDEDLKDYAIDSIRDGSYYLASHLLEALGKYDAEYFDYDRGMGTLDTPEPLKTKMDLVYYSHVEIID